MLTFIYAVITTHVECVYITFKLLFLHCGINKLFRTQLQHIRRERLLNRTCDAIAFEIVMSEETTIWLSLRFQKLKFRQYTKELKKLSNANEIAVCICFVWDVKLGSEWWKEKKNHTLQSLLKSSCPWFSPNFSLRKRLDRNIPTPPLWNTIPHQHIHSFESVLLLLTVCELI